MKGRKNGCPVNIKNWLVEVLDVATTEYVRIYGLSSLTRSYDSETEDGSADTDTWSEPYVTKRSGSISLSGKEVVDDATGANDAGQEILNDYADMSGCDADVTLRFTDPYGHCWIGDYVVTGRETSVDDSSTELTWDLEQVGEVEVQPYVQVTSIALKDSDSQAITTLALEMGDPAEVIAVAFTPATSSNKRFKVSNNKRQVVQITNVTESGFSIVPVGIGTANISVTSINGGKTASLAVTVTAGDD